MGHWKPSKMGEPSASSGLKFKEGKVDQKSQIVAVVVAEGFLTGAVVR